MVPSLSLSKFDARRALVRYHFSPASTVRDVFNRLRSIQFDPIAPVGCNHDLVLQARLLDSKIDDWEQITYGERQVYDGWDKQASLIPFSGWPARRIIHKWHRPGLDHIFVERPYAAEAILNEIRDRGPLMPKDCEFQERNEEWTGSWHGPSVAKQTLRALWHAGLIMTTGRKGGQHIYDLTERVVPGEFYSQSELSDHDALRVLVLELHREMGLLRPTSPVEIWSRHIPSDKRRKAIGELINQGQLIPVEVDGMPTHATPEFLAHLDLPPLEPRVTFIAPLDQFMWDRGMIGHLFDFEYIWEIYTPVVKRKWGYYVLPVLFGNGLVGRIEFWCRKGILEVRGWHYEAVKPGPKFKSEFRRAIRRFMKYASANSIAVDHAVDPNIRDLLESV